MKKDEFLLSEIEDLGDCFAKVVSADTLLSFLRQNLEIRELFDRVLEQHLVIEVSQRHGIVVTEVEIQAEGDRQRRELELEDVDDTLAWLAEEGVSLEDWEVGVRLQLLRTKLQMLLFDSLVEQRFAEQKVSYEQLVLYQCTVSEPRLAKELYYQVQSQEVSFYEMAHRHDTNPERRLRCGFEGSISRLDVTVDLSEVLFGAPVRRIVPPLKTEAGYALFWIEERIAPHLTPQLRQEILDELFQEWLEEEVRLMRAKGLSEKFAGLSDRAL